MVRVEWRWWCEEGEKREHSGEACVGRGVAWEAYRAALTPARDSVGPDRGGKELLTAPFAS